MARNIDQGPSGEGLGVYINWHARETNDGDISGRNFSKSWKDDDQKHRAVFDMTKGVPIDVGTVVTGWVENNENAKPGVAPRKIWGDDLAKFPEKPSDGQKYSKGFSVNLLVDKETAACWEQGAMGAFHAIMDLLQMVDWQKVDDEGLVPLVKHTGHDKVTIGNGTFKPTFEIVKYIKKPDLLADAPKPGSHAAADAGNGGQQAQQPDTVQKGEKKAEPKPEPKQESSDDGGDEDWD